MRVVLEHCCLEVLFSVFHCMSGLRKWTNCVLVFVPVVSPTMGACLCSHRQASMILVAGLNQKHISLIPTWGRICDHMILLWACNDKHEIRKRIVEKVLQGSVLHIAMAVLIFVNWFCCQWFHSLEFSYLLNRCACLCIGKKSSAYVWTAWNPRSLSKHVCSFQHLFYDFPSEYLGSGC